MLHRTTFIATIRAGYKAERCSFVKGSSTRGKRQLRCSAGRSMDDQDRFEAAAMKEAAELYMQAQQLATQQTQAELLQYLSSEPTTPVKQPAATNLAIESFWVEQGLNRPEAEALTRQILGLDPNVSTPQLTASVQRWRRVLPDVDIAELALKDCQLLLADVTAAVRNIVEMVTFLPQKDVISMIRKQPRLLWCDDLPQRMQRVVDKLVQLHPSKEKDVATDLVEEYPELLYRMDYYRSASQLDDLPIEIQNMMVLGDHGIGFLYRYYRNKHTSMIDTMESSDVYES